MNSTVAGLLKNVQKHLSRCFRSREMNKAKSGYFLFKTPCIFKPKNFQNKENLKQSLKQSTKCRKSITRLDYDLERSFNLRSYSFSCLDVLSQCSVWNWINPENENPIANYNLLSIQTMLLFTTSKYNFNYENFSILGNNHETVQNTKY